MQKKKSKLYEIDLVIFDVNQTMFSLNALKIKFKEFGLKQSLVNNWFLSVLKEGFSSSLSQQFVNFKTIGKNELTRIFLQNNSPYNNKIINSKFQNKNVMYNCLDLNDAIKLNKIGINTSHNFINNKFQKKNTKKFCCLQIARSQIQILNTTPLNV